MLHLEVLGLYVLDRLRSLFHLVPSHFPLANWLYFPSFRHQTRLYTQNELCKIPSGSWDSHMHVVDPSKYPLAEGALYTPTAHVLSQAMSFEKSVGIDGIVLVQPSVYGYDNSCLLNALRELGPERGRGVVSFDPETISSSTLREWHKIGVRGVRINLQSIGKEMDAVQLRTSLRNHARLIKPFNWVLQLYIPLHMASILESIVPELGVKVCLDHFGSPQLPLLHNAVLDPYALSGFDSLVRLLQQGSTYVKCSAPYRISSDPKLSDLEQIAKELLRVAGHKRVVFATDWPHTRFEGLDIKPFVEMVLNWCGDDYQLIDRVFKGNAEELWDSEQH